MSLWCWVVVRCPLTFLAGNGALQDYVKVAAHFTHTYGQGVALTTGLITAISNPILFPGSDIKYGQVALRNLYKAWRDGMLRWVEAPQCLAK